MSSNHTNDHLEQGALSTTQIVFLVLAAVTPIGAVVGALPVGIALGNGPGIAGAFVLAAIVLLLFGIGYAAMSHHVTNAGAFYAYIAKGLGRPAGMAAAGVAVVAYNCITISVAGGLGYFAHVVFDAQLGISLPWELWLGIFLALIAFLGARGVDTSARLLGVILVLEVLIILVLDVAILATRGLSAFSFSPFAPSTIFSGTVGVAFLYAFYTFIGFEATAIYAEEARDPKRTVGRATIISICIIGVFYAISSWALISAYGSDQVQAVAGTDVGGFVFGATDQFVGKAAADVMQFLLISSLFGATLGLHNATSRYFYALGRDGVLPRRLGRTDPERHAPYVASHTQVAITAVVAAGFAIAGADPYLQMSTSLAGIGTLGIIVLQAGAAISVVAFFARRREGRIWSTMIAPALGAAGLVTAAVLVVENYSALTGSKSSIVNGLPWILVLAAAAGLVYALCAPARGELDQPTLGADDVGDVQEVPA
jgi:amino acid transporter